jgi:hypothetical protein
LRIDNILAADNPFDDSGRLPSGSSERADCEDDRPERKRSERLQEPFLLMLVDMGSRHDSKDSQHVLESMISV